MNDLIPCCRYEDGVYIFELGKNEELPPLVYLHGLGDSGLCFHEVVRELANDTGFRGRRQLIPDMPGYGRSQLALVPLTLEAMADRVAEWLIERGEKRVSLIGHSMGGIVALMMAERHPRLIANLIDIEGNKTDDDCTFSRLPSVQTLGEFLVNGYREMKAYILEEQVPNKGCRGFEDKAYLRYYQSLQFCSAEALYSHSKQLVELSREGALAHRLTCLDCPAFFLYGYPWGTSCRSLAMVNLEDVPTSEIHPAGHWPFIDQPELCAWAITRALAYFASMAK